VTGNKGPKVSHVQVRFHGRGGQGVVIAAELLGSAAFRYDRYAQAAPGGPARSTRPPAGSACRPLFEARRCMSRGNCFGCDNCYGGACPDYAVIKTGPGGHEIHYDYLPGLRLLPGAAS
jgi:hypothetical protein